MALSVSGTASGPPPGFDAITLNHWLWFKYKCHEETPAEFQRLFENIVKRARPEFVAIRAYGNIGDRKCDGLFAADSTIFQVYAPDEWKQAELEAKVEEDFGGALIYWPTMRAWVFVYNVRRGLPPDIVRLLLAKRASHPTIEFDHWSSDRLWEMARGLSLQQRAGHCQVDERSAWLHPDVERPRPFSERTSPHPTPGTRPLVAAGGEQTAADVGPLGKGSVRGRARTRSVARGRPT